MNESPHFSEEARRAQEAACREVGVEIRALETMDEFRAAEDVEKEVWRVSDRRDVPVVAPFMRALEHSGGYVHGVFTRDGSSELIGLAIAFFGEPGQASMHSHIAGVLPRRALHGVGRALKLHQRWWALERGASRMTWTFDPLIARNAYFNITKLGAQVMEYQENFYGEMTDDVNRGDRSDRVFTLWSLTDPRVSALARATRSSASAAFPALAESALVIDPEGEPLVMPRPLESLETATIRIEIPDDMERLRLENPATASRWREALRGVLGGALGEGWQVESFNRHVGYSLSRALGGVKENR